MPVEVKKRLTSC